MARKAGDAEATRTQLILAGERLFAERGIDAVPLREIADAAGQANNTAVHYHFGSRERLVAAISAYRIAALEKIRAQMLDELPGQGADASLRELLGVLLLSQLQMVDGQGRHPYAHFMVQYLTQNRPSGMPHASDARTQDTETIHRLLGLIAQRLPGLTFDIIMRRLELLNLAFLAMLVRNDRARQHGLSVREVEEEAHETMIMLLAALSAS